MRDSDLGKIRFRNKMSVQSLTTVDTEESRNAFAALNKHKSSGVVRLKKRPSSRLGGGADTDIVDVGVAGSPTNVVISDGGGRKMGGALLYLVFWGKDWLANPEPVHLSWTLFPTWTAS